MLFGAGNLIFPPYLGWQCGSNWFWSFLCFILVDVGLSIAAIFVIAGNNKGGEGVLSKLGIRTGKILLFLITVFLGPLLAVPRAAATTFEMGVLPLIPEANSWVFAFAFFTRKRTIITRAEQSYGRVRCRTAGCQGISFSSSSWVGDLPR